MKRLLFIAPAAALAAGLALTLAPAEPQSVTLAAAVDPDHPGETATLDGVSFKLTWQPTPAAALKEIDDLVAAGTHGIEPVAMKSVVADANRPLTWKSGCPSGNDAIAALDAKVKVGAWCFPEDADNDWYPQGVATSRTPTLDGHVVSWYHKTGKTTDMTRITVGARPAVETAGGYRIVLLATPGTTAAGGLSVSDVRQSSSMAAQGVTDLALHAGGIAVDGDKMYVTDTGGGFRVFDLSRSYHVTTGKSSLGVDTDGKFYARGAKYVLFEMGRYVYDTTTAGECKEDTEVPDGPGENLCFSTVSVDRRYPTPGLISTEYRRTSGVKAGRPVRVVRWPLNADGSLTAPGGTVTSTTVYGTYTPRIQGVAAQYNAAQLTSFYYSTSLSKNDVPVEGTLYSERRGRDAWSITGPIGGESLALDPYAGGDRLWGVTEHPGKRMLYWAYRDALQPAGDS